MLPGKRLSKVLCPPQPSPGVSFASAWAQPGGCSLQGSNGSLPWPQGGVSTNQLVRGTGGATHPLLQWLSILRVVFVGLFSYPLPLVLRHSIPISCIPAFFQLSIQLLCTTLQTLEVAAPAVSPRLLKDHSRPKAPGESNGPSFPHSLFSKSQQGGCYLPKAWRRPWSCA